jgi:FAD/FMN-containing dehydrogenase
VQVKWAVNRNVSFLVQNGGNGWTTTFDIDNNDIVIQLDQLRAVTFNSARTEVTVGGGALISDVVAAASANNALVATGNCNCVGMLGAVLGGGIGNLMGQFGLGVDQVLSLNIVDAFGRALTVRPSNALLWYAMRGAGPNFAVVTSAVLRAYPVTEAGLNAWTGSLIFRPDQLETIVGIVQNLSFRPEMALTLAFVNQAAIASQIIVASIFYHGSANEGHTAFKALFDAGPVSQSTAIVPYTAWNNGSNAACQKGGRRPTWGAGLARMDPDAWRRVFNVWAALIKEPGAEKSSILLNAYATDKIRSLPDSSSAVPWRHTIRFHASFTASYGNASFDATAQRYGQQARALWQATDALAQDSVYINNAFGDESLLTVYGNSLAKLRLLKKVLDPTCRFNQWFSLC